MPSTRFRDCLSSSFRSDRSRTFWSLFLQLGGAILMIVVLSLSSSSPTSSLQWGKCTLSTPSGLSSLNFGLLRYQSCFSPPSGCFYFNVNSISNGGNQLQQAGQAVLTATTFALFFALFACFCLVLTVTGRKEKLKFPRTLLFLSHFLALTLYIVALSSWYKLGQSVLPQLYDEDTKATAGNVEPGYAVAVEIIVIVMSFFAFFFAEWRTCRPKNEDEASAKSVEGSGGSGSGSSAENSYAAKYQHQASSSALETGKKQVAAAAAIAADEEPNTYSNGEVGGAYGYQSPSSSSGGGAYDGSYGNNNNSSYGNNNSSYGGGSSGGSAYDNAGAAYSSKRESAYGY